jgi:hypothetical protein
MTSSDQNAVPNVFRNDSPEENGHISVMIPYPTYRRILAYLEAISSSLKPDELIASILEGWVRKLNL